MKINSAIENTSIYIFLACFVSYAIICMTKTTYSSAIATIVSEGVLTKSNLGLINAAFYLFYGSTQFLGGYLSDRISPFLILLIGLVGSAAANIVMANSDAFIVLLVAWSFNGAIQFGIWPAIIKIISSVILPEHRQKAKFFISFAYTIGSIFSYLIANIILKYWSWNALFASSAIFLGLPVLLIILSVIRNKKRPIPAAPIVPTYKKQEEVPVADISLRKALFTTGLLCLSVTSLVRCMLDIGLKSWVPTMIVENYDISISFANNLTIILLIVNLSGLLLSAFVHPKICKNAATAIALFYIISTPLLAILLPIGKIPVSVVITILISVTTLMTAVSQIANITLAITFAKYGKSGTVAGLINAFSAFGCMFSTYLYGWVAENFGWISNIWIWIGLSAVSAILALIAMPLWSRFTSK